MNKFSQFTLYLFICKKYTRVTYIIPRKKVIPQNLQTQKELFHLRMELGSLRLIRMRVYGPPSLYNSTKGLNFITPALKPKIAFN